MKRKFIELNFKKMEEEFDESLFSKDEMKTIHKIVSLYTETSAEILQMKHLNLMMLETLQKVN